VLLLVAGVVFVARAVGRVGVHRIWVDCLGAGPLVILVFLAPAVGQFLHALGWRFLLPLAARPPVARAYRIFLAAQAGNEVGFGCLGEPLKVSVLPPRHRDDAVAAVVMDNATAFLALLLFFGTGCALSGAALPGAARVARVAGGVLLASLLGAGVVATWFGTGKATTTGVARSRPGGSLVTHARRALVICREMVAARPRDVVAATLLHYLGKLWIIAEFALLLGLIGKDARASAVFGVLSAAGSAVGAPVPGQLGIVESAILQAAALTGVAVSTALAMALIRRVRGWFWVLVGALSVPAPAS
jgi:hypothetical protein